MVAKFADDYTVVGLISNNDETHYREKIYHLIQLCSTNNLVLNTSKTKEIVVEYWRSRRTEHVSVRIHGKEVERVDHISSWSSTSFIWPVLVSEHLTSGKEAPTSSFFLRKLKHAGLSFQLRVNETCSWIQVLTFWLWKNYLIGPIAQPTEIKTAVFAHIYYHTILKSLSLQNFSLHLSQTSVWQKTSWCAKLFIGSFHKCTMFSGGQWDITWP